MRHVSKSCHEYEQSDFKWYQIVEGNSLEQGDFLRDFPILLQPENIPTSTDELQHLSPAFTIDVDSILIFNVVVMTQSCDFNKLRDEDPVTLCPRYNYSEIIKDQPKLDGKGGWKSLIRGLVIEAHLLNKCEIDGYQFDYQVVDLKQIFSVPYGVVKKIAEREGKRVRLLPPYREHLAQAFARRFMRVGLPIDLPPEYPY